VKFDRRAKLRSCRLPSEGFKDAGHREGFPR
jgi:hypothetical protein